MPPPAGHPMELTLGRLLRTGVLLAAAVVAAGGAWFVIRHGGESPDYARFRGVAPELLRPSAILAGIAAGHSRSLIQFGLLLLIATPVARVLVSLVLFLHERDYLYTSITAFVLLILAAGAFGW